jgi:hypothetical protein
MQREDEADSVVSLVEAAMELALGPVREDLSRALEEIAACAKSARVAMADVALAADVAARAAIEVRCDAEDSSVPTEKLGAAIAAASSAVRAAVKAARETDEVVHCTDDACAANAAAWAASYAVKSVAGCLARAAGCKEGDTRALASAISDAAGNESARLGSSVTSWLDVDRNARSALSAARAALSSARSARRAIGAARLAALSGDWTAALAATEKAGKAAGTARYYASYGEERMRLIASYPELGRPTLESTAACSSVGSCLVKEDGGNMDKRKTKRVASAVMTVWYKAKRVAEEARRVDKHMEYLEARVMDYRDAASDAVRAAEDALETIRSVRGETDEKIVAAHRLALELMAHADRLKKKSGG